MWIEDYDHFHTIVKNPQKNKIEGKKETEKISSEMIMEQLRELNYSLDDELDSLDNCDSCPDGFDDYIDYEDDMNYSQNYYEKVKSDIPAQPSISDIISRNEEYQYKIQEFSGYYSMLNFLNNSGPFEFTQVVVTDEIRLIYKKKQMKEK